MTAPGVMYSAAEYVAPDVKLSWSDNMENSMDTHETKLIYGPWKGAQWSAYAWRRPPEFPDWSVYVKFGDDGYECDPGIYGKPLDIALLQVEEAIEQLEGIWTNLKAMQREQDRG